MTEFISFQSRHDGINVLQHSGSSVRARYVRVMDVLEHDLRTGKYAARDCLPGWLELSTADAISGI